MKPCPYRKEHEFDDEGLCKNCYAKRPPPPEPPKTDETQPMQLPSGWGGLSGHSVWGPLVGGGSFTIPVATRSNRPATVPAHARLVTDDPVMPPYWIWTDPTTGTTHVAQA